MTRIPEIKSRRDNPTAEDVEYLLNENEILSQEIMRVGEENAQWKERASVRRCMQCGELAMSGIGFALRDENQALRRELEFARESMEAFITAEHSHFCVKDRIKQAIERLDGNLNAMKGE